MTPQQKDLLMNALRIGEGNSEDLSTQVSDSYVSVIESDIQTIRSAIKELEAMPTEEEGKCFPNIE
jgi:hypothetical protein